MKIVLVTEAQSQPLSAQTFDGEVVRVGRDPANCEIVFEQKTFPMVSRRHAELRENSGKCLLIDNSSSYGTYLNNQKVETSVEIVAGSRIQFGKGGPILRVQSLEIARAAPRREPEKSAPPQFEKTGQTGNLPATLFGGNLKLSELPAAKKTNLQPQLLLQAEFNGKNILTVGRGKENDIRLEGLQISKLHARFVRAGNTVAVEDAGSTNGVFYDGKRISGRKTLSASDVVQIGAFQLAVDFSQTVSVYDTRSKTRIDALHVSKSVKNNSGAGVIKLLDDVSLTIQPNEFVGLLGPSGAGKSTLMDALNGMRPPSSGNVLFNNLDFYANLDALKQSIGYVPQDDRLHRELTVYRTLFYVAKLRLSRDASNKEIENIIGEVLDVTGLTERRDIPVSELSGGQRKRVSIAVELITKPSVIFLDEPTSGLDPATEDKVMKLFRRIAESGRTIVLTTHAMENVRLFDKIVVLMRGKLAFYGTPSEALKFVQASDFKELYDKLEEPIAARLSDSTELNVGELKRRREQITEEVAENWKQKFLKTEQYRRNVFEPLQELSQTKTAPARPRKRRLGLIGAIGQTFNLARRYSEVLSRDRLNLAVLLIQAPVIALMTFLVVPATQPRDFIYFIVSLVAVWFGTSVAAREIVRETPVFRRERMVNLGLTPYILSKLIVLGAIVAVQCLLLFIPLKLLHLVGLTAMPGATLPQLFTMLLTAFVGIALGLLISAFVKTSEMATSLVPLILIPQILFSGLVGVPNLPTKIVGLAMPAAWSFDAMKRFSGLDTLEPEGSKRRGANEGLGLYDATEKRNDELIAQTREDLDEYKRRMKNYFADQQAKVKSDEPAMPEIKDAEKLPENLGNYVTFLHPWMNALGNQIVLFIMFFALVLATIFALRRQDIR